ncbi:multidrug and toxin extrusion protein 2-like [Hyperolius riggenbachi]|uniref:multidrug and toxin extrusion protein 2-like n=1 Tax=Hyperolius riggenbachi TaxID=752182 RepID=UPI0035A2BF73
MDRGAGDTDGYMLYKLLTPTLEEEELPVPGLILLEVPRHDSPRPSSPLFLSQTLILSISIVSAIFCGRLGKIEFDSVQLAVTVINITGLAVGTGLASTCDTLLSQTYGGRNLKRVGTIIQRGILILLLCCFPCWAIFINTEQLLLLCKQDPRVARLTQKYVMIFIPAVPAAFLYQLQTRYLQNQHIIWPQVVTGLAVNLINVTLNAIFINGLKLGVEGSALANTLSNILLFIVLYLYILVKKLHVPTWGGWSTDCLQEWGSFIRLAIPSMLMVCIEWWSYEIGGFLAGLISIVELGAQTILLEVAAMNYSVALGLAVAANVRIGNALGAGDVEQAKTSCKVVLLCIVSCSLVTGSLLAGLKDVFAYIFTYDREIVTLVSQVMFIFVPFQLFDGVAGTCAGILQGTGKQKVGAATSVIGYYFLGLPTGISLMFSAKLGIIGLWSGLIFPVFLQATFNLLYILHMDWNKACKEAQIRGGVKTKNYDSELHDSQLDSSNSFNMISNGDLQSFATGHSVTGEDVWGPFIGPDTGLGDILTEPLVPHDNTPLETLNIVGEILSTKQLILRRGSAVILAVMILLVGVTVKLLTGNRYRD